MGCFGYMCRGCGISIRGDCFTGGENCVMIHVRHGEELGRIEGHYDEYGCVIEQEGLPEDQRFRGMGDHINGHDEICTSEFDFKDSSDQMYQEMRLYDGVPQHYTIFHMGIAFKNLKDIMLAEKLGKIVEPLTDDEICKIWDSLPILPTPPIQSGIVAWHKKCYDEATEEERQDLTPSASDPNQSWGDIREEYK